MVGVCDGVGEHACCSGSITAVDGGDARGWRWRWSQLMMLVATVDGGDGIENNIVEKAYMCMEFTFREREYPLSVAL